MFQHLFSRTDVFLLFIILLTISTFVINTMCKCVKKAILTFALATVLLRLFIQEKYKKHKFYSYINSFSENFSKLLINNPHVSPHQLRPKNLQQHQQILKQVTPNHQHASLFKTTHTHLKKDRYDFPNH